MTIKELEKKYSSRLIERAETSSWGGQDTQQVGRPDRQGHGWRARWSYI